MRVIAGLAKGRRLAPVPGPTTRPITDRAKEALFSALHDWIPQRRVLDLFGGTGAVGLEALSRGAAQAHFVDASAQAVATIQRNGAQCRFLDRMRIVRGDSFRYLARCADGPFDLVFIAPPQYQGLWRRALQALDARPELLTPDGRAVIQIDPREDADVPLTHMVRYDQRRYGRVLLCFYESAPGAPLSVDPPAPDA